MKKCWFEELLIINEKFQVHYYIGETLDPLVEHETITCFYKEWFTSYEIQEKPRKNSKNRSPLLELWGTIYNKWKWLLSFLMTFQLLWLMGFHTTFHILYITFYIPHVSLHILHVSLGLHYIKIITKEKIHKERWKYKTKILIGQNSFEQISHFLLHGGHLWYTNATL